jgi:hypothetical protein
MSYHEEERVALLITNYERWAGDNPVQGAGQLWLEDKIAMRDLIKDFRSNFGVFEALGAEASLTKDTLVAMTPALRFAVRTFHLSSLTFEMQAREIVRVSKSTYHTRLVRGHFEFMELFDRHTELARAKARSYAASASI